MSGCNDENFPDYIHEAFNTMVVQYGARSVSRISQDIGKLEFLINSDIVIKKVDANFDKPVFCYVDIPKGLQNVNFVDSKEILEGFKNKETVRELQLQHTGVKVSAVDLSVQFELFLQKNKIKINEVSVEDLINPGYLNQFHSFNMNCYKSIIGIMREIRKELESVQPLANQLIDNFNNERDRLVDSFIKEQSSFVMEHFINYEAMMARKKDKVMSLMGCNGKYSSMSSDITSRSLQTVKNLVPFRVKELIKNLSSYDRYLYTFPLGRIVGLSYMVMFSLDEIMEENGVRVL